VTAPRPMAPASTGLWPRVRVPLFKAVAILEGLSWLGLLTGMYFKHLAGTGEQGVHVFGPVHGGVFLAYVLLTLLVGRALRWPARVVLWGLAASVPPFATVLFERWAQRTGRLADDPAPAAVAGEPALD
jgi:integral membrane protein